MKTCFKCGEAKPYSEYYKHPAMGDGHLGKCKDCAKKDVADRVQKRKTDPDFVVEDARYFREKMATRRAAGKVRKEPAETRKETLRRHAEKYPEKAIARTALGNAVRDGKIVRLPCERCGSADSEGHHDDYSKPLEVIWLCPKHHAERHVELRDIQRRQRALAKQAELQPC